MQFLTIFRILGILLMIFSFSMLPPEALAWFYSDGGRESFLVAFLVTFMFGFICWLPCRHFKSELKTRDGFLIVILFWTVLSVFGAIPFAIMKYPTISITDAIFESTSGLTTTGTNVLSGLDYLPHAVRYYRQQLEFLGGMGIVVLAVAVLPMLGIGGMQLFRAETPGPMKDNKLTPRITETAKRLWYIYVGLTITCAVAYWVAGMPPFDAIGESFSTVSTGGFSTHDTSFAFYNSGFIDSIAIVFMVLGSINFGLHYLAMQRRSISRYWQDSEFRVFVYILAILTLIVIISLFIFGVYKPGNSQVIKGVFTVVSMATTTGLTTTRFDQWPRFLPYLLMISAIVGGCAASTSGGIKVIRAMLLQRQGLREMTRLIHPKAVLSIRLGGEVLPEQAIEAVWGFVAVFIALYVMVVLLLLASGLDFTTSFGAATSCLSNVGASIGKVANSFENISTAAKWILIFTMVAGRLEVFTLLLIFMPAFWRR